MIFWRMGGRRLFFSLKHLWAVDDFFVWMKSTILTFTFLLLGVNFINVYARVFRTKFWLQKITKLCFGFEIFGAKILYEKQARKTLMKLTLGRSSAKCSESANLSLRTKSNFHGKNHQNVLKYKISIELHITI